MKRFLFALFFASLSLIPQIVLGQLLANYGKYGIQKCSNVKQYKQSYTGQTVMYIPINKGSYEDSFFQRAGGKFNIEYVITKISGNDRKMKFFLTEKGTKNKVKMWVANYPSENNAFNNFFEISGSYAMPLILSDKFKADKAKYVGQKYPQKPNNDIQFEITDMVVLEQDNSIYYNKEEKDDFKWWERNNGLKCKRISQNYSVVAFELCNKADSSLHYIELSNSSDLKELGKVFRNSKFKCVYNVVDIYYKNKYYNSDYHVSELENLGRKREYVIRQKFFKMRNSINGEEKEVNAERAEKDAFKGDDKGSYIATLSKVEKPTNPAVRYGEYATIENKNITKYNYVDNFIDIILFCGERSIDFVLNNVSNNTIKIVWDEAVFVDVDGSCSKVMHSGTKYSQKENTQPASVILKGTKIEDIAVPIDKVHSTENNWHSDPLLSSASQVKGQTIKLMLPIQVKDVINEYIFEFDVKYIYEKPELIAD